MSFAYPISGKHIKYNNKKGSKKKNHSHPNQSHVNPPPSAHSGMAATPTPMPCELKMSKF